MPSCVAGFPLDNPLFPCFRLTRSNCASLGWIYTTWPKHINNWNSFPEQCEALSWFSKQLIVLVLESHLIPVYPTDLSINLLIASTYERWQTFNYICLDEGAAQNPFSWRPCSCFLNSVPSFRIGLINGEILFEILTVIMKTTELYVSFM